MKTYTSTDTKELVINGTVIPYTLTKSAKRRSISVQISPGGEVSVKSPYFVTKRTIETFLYKKSDWIYAHYIEALGKTKKDIRKDEDEAKKTSYKKLARKVITARTEYYASILGTTYNTLSIRDQKTRWGSCSGRNNLSFNWRLILAPPEILDYVVVHELCHLVHMNHSKEFWTLVGSILPDYKIRRKWLKENGHTLHL